MIWREYPWLNMRPFGRHSIPINKVLQYSNLTSLKQGDNILISSTRVVISFSVQSVINRISYQLRIILNNLLMSFWIIKIISSRTTMHSAIRITRFPFVFSLAVMILAWLSLNHNLQKTWPCWNSLGRININFHPISCCSFQNYSTNIS